MFMQMSLKSIGLGDVFIQGIDNQSDRLGDSYIPQSLFAEV